MLYTFHRTETKINCYTISHKCSPQILSILKCSNIICFKMYVHKIYFLHIDIHIYIERGFIHNNFFLTGMNIKKHFLTF